MKPHKKINNKIFRGQREDENIILVLHRHPATLFLSITKPLIIAIAIIIVLVVYVYSNPMLFSILFIMLLLSLIWVFYEWLCWWLDIFIVTDQRIIDIDQKSLFNKRVSEATWDKVQDVTYEIKGVTATFFDYGSVFIQTAGAIGVVTFAEIAEPDKIKSLITDIQKDPGKFTALAKEIKSGFRQKKVE